MVGRRRKIIASHLGISCRYLGVPEPTTDDAASDDSQSQSEANHDEGNAHDDEEATNGIDEVVPGADEEETDAVGEKGGCSLQTQDSDAGDPSTVHGKEKQSSEMNNGNKIRSAIASAYTNDEGQSSDKGSAEGRPTLFEKSFGTSKREMFVSAPLGRGGTRDVLSGVEFEPALIRAHMNTGRGGMDLRLTEAAALYGQSTLRYTSALDDDSIDAARALGQIYRDFEERQVQLFFQFHADHEMGATQEEDSPKTSTPLNKVLSASTELLTETELLWDNARKKKVRFAMPPRFAPHRAVDLAWTAAVASVCARRIWRQAGGSDGHRLPSLTVTELLDAIAWVEHFQDTVERIDTELSSRLRGRARRMAQVDLDDMASRPRLFAAEGGGATEKDASDGLAWVYAALDDLSLVAQDELVIRSRTQTSEWASKVYHTEHVIHQTRDGRLFTSLPEDIFSTMATQLHTLCDRLPLSSDALPTIISGVLSTLRQVQLKEGCSRLSDFEHRCAAANDFERMGEEWESIVFEILRECFPDWGRAQDLDDDDELKSRFALKEKLEAVSAELVHTFMSDAVRAAKSVILPVFHPIRIALESELFGLEWEDNWTQNELAGTLTATVEDFLGDLRSFLEEFLLEKTTGALISASVVFYIECLLKKAGGHGGVKASSFVNNDRALLRISGDVDVMRDYFQGLEVPALERTIEEEFKVLAEIHELMSIAAGISSSEPHDFILPLHKRIRDVHNTKQIVKDLWHLISPKAEKTMSKTVSAMESDLLAVAPPEHKVRATKEQNKLQVPGMRLDDMVEELYADDDDSTVIGDVTHDLMSKSGEKLARGRANFSRGRKKLAKATKLGKKRLSRSPLRSRQGKVAESTDIPAVGIKADEKGLAEF